jgi:heterodisulfide reductase subunit A2
MKIGVYFCRCGGIISDKIDQEEVERRLGALGEIAYFQAIDLACDEGGRAAIAAHIGENKPDRVIFLACSPREHEQTFRGVLASGGLNPFLMQMVNVREQVAWVTPDRRAATEKTIHYARAATARVRRHEPLEKREIEVSTDALVIGAGPAGLKAALTLAEAGRKVVLVEKGPILGGMPVRYEEVFPRMECGPCVLEPFMAEVLQGHHAKNIEILLQSEVTAVAGSFGTFVAKIRRNPRHVDLKSCIGCAECIAACPVSEKNELNCNRNERKAMDFAFFGGLPNVPYIDPQACLRSRGEDCTKCREACPIEGAVDLDEQAQVLERHVGAIVVAVGGGLYDCKNLPQLGYGRVPDVVTSLEFERILAASGPTEGRIELSDGSTPSRVGIVHCVGSLDQNHREYCSGVCCMNAFKFNTLISHKLHDARVTHFYKVLAMPGKEEHELYATVSRNDRTEMVRFDSIEELSVRVGENGHKIVSLGGTDREFDLVILMPALVPSSDAVRLGKILDLGLDRQGYFEELHGRVDATKSKVRGIYLAGTCQAPMDLGRSMTQGSSACGAILAALVPGRKLELEAIHAEVDAERCSACKSCVSVCPYKAVGFNAEKNVSEVNPVLCVGCGTCVSACPSGAIVGRHFTTDQILREIEGALA